MNHKCKKAQQRSLRNGDPCELTFIGKKKHIAKVKRLIDCLKSAGTNNYSNVSKYTLAYSNIHYYYFICIE